MSVKPTTPARRPLILDPGRELADTEGPDGWTNGGFGDASEIAVESAVEACGMFAWFWPDALEIEELCDEVGTSVAEFNDGVGGPDEKGDEGSVTQRR